MPLRFTGLAAPHPAVLLLGLIVFAAVTWALTALAFRRAADAGVNAWIAAFAVSSILQLPLIIFLTFSARRFGTQAGAAPAKPPSQPAAAAQGTIAGVALTLLGVGIGTLLFREYGVGVFVAAPFLVGAITAFFVNRAADIGAKATRGLVMRAVAIGAPAVAAVAIEGFVCLALAAPIWLGLAIVGGPTSPRCPEHAQGPR